MNTPLESKSAFGVAARDTRGCGNTLGARLFWLRQQVGFTQQEASTYLQLRYTHNHLVRWEKDYSEPSLWRFYRLCLLYQTRSDWLLTGVGDPYPEKFKEPAIYTAKELACQVGRQLRRARYYHGWSQQELAQRMEKKQSFVSSAELARYGPRPSTLLLFSQHLFVCCDRLLGFVGSYISEEPQADT